MQNKIKQAVILAGGKGERLKPLTNSIPKPMAPVKGTPFLDYLIFSIINTGINNILLLLGYKSDQIIKRYNNISKINFEFSIGSEKDKTGRRILNAFDKLEDHFLLMYGDNYWPIELDSMCLNYNRLKSPITTTVFSNKEGTGEYGFQNNINVNLDGMVSSYDKKRERKQANGVDIGYFIVSKKTLNSDVKGNISFEESILPNLIKKNKLGAYITDEQYYFITNSQTLNNFKNAVENNNFLPLPKSYFK